MRKAALVALSGSPDDIKEFLTTGQHTAQADDYRVEILRLMKDGGPSVNERGSAAIDAGTVDRLREFLDVGQYAAREVDDRAETLRIMHQGGARVKAAAEVALAGPPSMLRDFVGVAHLKAAKQDFDAAVHVAEVNRLVANAQRSAATAKKNAAQAAEAEARARHAADEANKYAKQARDSATEAQGHADDAKKSAHDADVSAESAADSARQAKQAAASAGRAAVAATASANQASSSAAQARTYADLAYASAESARKSARDANKDAAEAAKAATEAVEIAAEKWRKEDAERRKDTSEPSGGKGAGTVDALKDYENGSALLSFDGTCYLNGVPLPDKLGIGSCEALAADFDRWMGDNADHLRMDTFKDRDDAAAMLLAGYCSWTSNSIFSDEGNSDKCGPELMKQLQNTPAVEPYLENGIGSGLARLFKPLGRKLGWKWLGGFSRPLGQLAHNRYLHEAYKDILRAEMQKPQVGNEKLQEFMDVLWRKNAVIGNGSTAAAVRFTKLTGKLVGGSDHIQKAEEAIVFLSKWIRNNPEAATSDRLAAENVMRDLQNSLEGKP
ncbi:hypothetical protein [Streptomyces kronopolitis]|uniref:ALF repeat-containing protein n=1 Tax=Streptomyces kronopolitis TaxID=1612435 RepID=UPI003D960701